MEKLFNILSVCKGGGYMYCRTEPKHPKANSKGLYPLHRVVAENKIGRLLNDNEDVHHVDENKMNNHPDNLEVLTKAEHTRLHMKKNGVVELRCPKCSSVFQLPPNVYRLRQRRNKTGKIFCSRSCGSSV